MHFGVVFTEGGIRYNEVAEFSGLVYQLGLKSHASFYRMV